MEGEGSPSAKRMRLSSSTHYSSGGKNKACIIFYCHVALPNQSLKESRIECNICIVDLTSSVGTLVDDVDSKSDNPVGLLGGDDVYDDGDADGDFDYYGDGDGDVDARYNKGFTSVSPTLQIDCGVCIDPPNDAFCVLDEKLYMFEGCIDQKDTRNSVFALDLTESLTTLTKETKKLEKGGPLLKKIGEMLSPKAYPMALATPDGKKIIVLPTWWPNIHIKQEDMSSGGFEIFDPANPQSPPEPLPPITGVYCTRINRYGFIEDSDKFLVQISYGGMRVAGFRVLDLASTNKEWVNLGAFYNGLDLIPPACLSPSFFETVEKRRLCFVNDHGIYDQEDFFIRGSIVRDFDFVSQFSVPREEALLFGKIRDGHYGRNGRLCLFYADIRVARCFSNRDEERKDHRYHFCQMTMERLTNWATESCRVVLSVCSFDLKLYDERVEMFNDDDSRLECTKLVGDHKFLLGFEGERKLEDSPHLFFTF